MAWEDPAWQAAQPGSLRGGKVWKQWITGISAASVTSSLGFSSKEECSWSDCSKALAGSQLAVGLFCALRIY